VRRLALSVNTQTLGISLAIFIAGVMLLLFCFSYSVQAANPNLINFQGKVVNANGTNVTDGTYSFNFILFSDPTLGAESDGVYDKWHELNKSVQVTSGVFQTNLGSATALPDFNADPSLYLAVKFNSDVAGYMTPRIQMTSVPYALNSDKLNGLDSTNFVRLAQGSQTDTSTTNPSIFINKNNASGSPNILQLQKAGGDVFVIDNGGLVTIRPATGADSASAFQLQRAGGSETLLTADTTARSASGGNIIKIGNSTGTDTATTILRVDSATADPTTNVSALTGGIYYRSDTGDLKFIASGGTLRTVAYDLQSAYTNSASPADITLANAKNLTITAADTAVDPNVLINLACSTCSANGGRFAVQDNGTDVFATNPDGSMIIAPTAGQPLTVNLAAGSQSKFIATAAPTADLVTIDNTSQTVATGGVNGLQITYVGGSGAIESSAAQIDFTPGASSGSTWSGLRITADATGAATGVTQNGLKLTGPTSPGAGNEYAISIDAGWDAGLNFESVNTDPPTPAAGTLSVYAKKIAGRNMLKGKGASGVDVIYQPSFIGQQIQIISPSTGTAQTTLGNTATNSGTLSHPAATEASGWMTNYATANVGCPCHAGTSFNNATFFRGSTAGASGFFFYARIYLPDASYANTRTFFGMSNQALTVMGASDNPAGSYAGFQFSTARGDTNFMFVTKDGTTQATPVNSGVAFTALKMYDMYVYVASQGTTISWQIDNLTDGTTSQCGVGAAPACSTANLPAGNAALRGIADLSAVTNGTARNIRTQRLYVESDR
jgi:hypothetical protein